MVAIATGNTSPAKMCEAENALRGRVQLPGLRRYYNPGLGRWVNRDPIGDEAFSSQFLKGKSSEAKRGLRAQGRAASLSVFVENAPMDHVDGLGLIVYRVDPIPFPRRYFVKKCTIVIFNARHADYLIPIARDRLVVERCGNTCAVGCQVDKRRPFFPAPFPGCELTTKDVVWYRGQGTLEPGQTDGDPLMRRNIAAARTHALKLCDKKGPCCCKEVKIKVVNVGKERWKIPSYDDEPVKCPE